MIWQSFEATQAYIVRANPGGRGSQGICRFAPDGELRFTLPCAAVLGLSGVVVGTLSGFFGVGGGFLIVPALMYVIRMDIAYAVGSSLAIIALIGFFGGAFKGFPILLAQPVALLFFVGSLLGLLLGRVVAKKLSGPILQRLFALALLTTGITMLARNL